MWQHLFVVGHFVAVLMVCFMFFWWSIRWCYRWQRNKRYQQINPTEVEEDLVLAVEDN
jgi:hypothetical protein